MLWNFATPAPQKKHIFSLFHLLSEEIKTKEITFASKTKLAFIPTVASAKFIKSVKFVKSVKSVESIEPVELPVEFVIESVESIEPIEFVVKPIAFIKLAVSILCCAH